MNYYIQGDAAKAEQIKAAFEAKGLITSGHDYHNDNILFFTYDLEGGCKVISSTNANLIMSELIKTHPDYKELELPVQSKFNVGDLIVRGSGFIYEPLLITEIRDYYICENQNGERATYTLNDVHKNFHLWTIADAKDGDVLTINGKPFIYSQHKYEKNYCYIDSCGQFRVNFSLVFEGNCVCPATKEQRDLLFSKMREAGYQWDVDKKELRKIKSHYDISNFQPFDKVLIRHNDSSTWGVSFFGFYSGLFMCCTNVWFEQCIPFNEETKHLLGTTDMPDEMYVNW